MNRTICRLAVALFLVLSLSAITWGAGLSVCDYEPPESRIADLSLLGSFNWVDGPYADDRNRSISASLVGDYTGIYSSAAFAGCANGNLGR